MCKGGASRNPGWPGLLQLLIAIVHRHPLTDDHLSTTSPHSYRNYSYLSAILPHMKNSL